MFGKNSRYFGLGTVTVIERGRSVKAVKLRHLPATRGKPFMVRDGNQLDVLSEQRYKDSTRFWHVADANSELEANQLVVKTGRIIQVPES